MRVFLENTLGDTIRWKTRRESFIHPRLEYVVMRWFWRNVEDKHRPMVTKWAWMVRASVMFPLLAQVFMASENLREISMYEEFSVV